MAQKAYSIEDGNLQSKAIITTRQKVYSDLDLTFARAPSNDVFKKTDAAAVKQSVKNILLTNKLEKPFLPSFGGDLNNFLFELSEDFDEEIIEDNVKNAIQIYEPRARIIDVVATVQSDINDVRVTVKFQVINTSEEVTLSVSLARLR
jgi:phage baseplate assembly protein W